MAVPKFTSASALKSVKMSKKDVSKATKASLRILELLLNSIKAKVA